MNENLKDILSNLNPDIDQETLLRYLQGKLSPEEQHEIEKGMMESDFDSDALEGLQGMKDKKNLTLLLQQLQKDLKKKTEKKKKARQKLQLKLEPWLLVALVIILIIAVISFILVRKQMQG